MQRCIREHFISPQFLWLMRAFCYQRSSYVLILRAMWTVTSRSHLRSENCHFGCGNFPWKSNGECLILRTVSTNTSHKISTIFILALSSDVDWESLTCYIRQVNFVHSMLRCFMVVQVLAPILHKAFGPRLPPIRRYNTLFGQPERTEENISGVPSSPSSESAVVIASVLHWCAGNILRCG